MKTMIVTAMTGFTMLFSSCTPNTPNDLDRLGTTDVAIGELKVQAWIADEHDERMKGLMFVTGEELAPLPDGRRRGMIFLFDQDQTTGFWMKNTIVDLDIAFIRKDRTIVQMFTMTALSLNVYTPRSPYRFALEVPAGTFARFGTRENDVVDIPDSVLNRSR